MIEGYNAALSWFFGVGASVFERSTFGPMLDHVERLAFKRIAGKCRKCKDSGDPGVLRDGSWCDRCLGTGGIISRHRSVDDPSELMPANETSSSSGGYLPDDSMMTRYAVISRRLSVLTQMEREALAAYHGDPGTRCEKIRRIISVYPLTEPGKKLVLLDSQASAPPYERAYRQVELQAIDHQQHRGALIAAADEQSHELYARAWGRWSHAA